MNRRLIPVLLIAVLQYYVEGLTIFCSKKLTFGDNYDILITNAQPEFKDKELNLKLVAHELNDDDVFSWKNKINIGEIPININLSKRDVAHNYTLTAFVAGSDFNQSIEIITISNHHPIHIQTTKNFYHRGENVSFQLITLDQKMKLYQPEKLRVKVVDTVGRSVYEQFNLQTRIIDSVLAEQFLIPLSTAVGLLKIQAFVNLKRKEVLRGEKEIEILDEAVPDLKLHVNVLQSNEQLITIEVYAMHSFGQRAKGNVDVSAWFEGESSRRTKSAKVEDSGKFSFDLDLSTKNAFMMFEIKFEEALTGQKVYKRIRREVCSVNCYELDIKASKLIPGFPLSLQIKLSKVGLIGLSGTKKVPVAIKIQYTSNCLKFSEELFEIEIENNEASFSKDIPQNVSEITVEASYLTAKKKKSFKASPSASKASLKLSLLTDRPTVGEYIQIKVDSSAVLLDTHYVVSQASKVLFNGSSDALFTKEDEIEFKVTSRMLPSIDITYFYYMTGTGETIYDKIRVDLHESIELKLSVTPSELEPGQNVTIVVQGQPNSTVTLMAKIEQETSRKSMYERNRQETTDFISLEPTSLKMCSLRSKRDIDVLDDDSDPLYDEEDIFPIEDLSKSWHLETIRTDGEGFYTANKTVPNTIDTWSVSAFSIAPNYGESSNSVQVKVFQKFFIKTVFPTSVQFGEIAKISVIVYKQIEDEEAESTVEVKMSKSEGEDFEFIYVEENCEKALHNQLGKSHQVTLSKKSPFEAATFFIRPTKSGKIPMTFKADDEEADLSTEFETFINIRKGEITKQHHSSTALDLRVKSLQTSRTSFEGSIHNALDGTASIEGSLAGKMFRSDFFDVMNLMTKPTGSNEPNNIVEMINTMITLKHLSEVNQLSPQNIDGSNKFILDGYRRLLERKNADGSFSFLGYGMLKRISLTAQVVKCLDEIGNLTTINLTVMKNALEFLKKQQISDRNSDKFGSFIERGSEHEHDIMLTARVAISLLENSKYKDEFEEVSKIAVKYLNEQFIKLQKNFHISILAYVMALAQDESVTSYFSDLIRKVTNFDEMNSSTEDNVENLATGAFTVLACLKAGKAEEAIKPMLWILERVPNFDLLDLKKHLSVITQAMVKFSEVFYSHKTSMNVTVSENLFNHKMSIGSAHSGGLKTFKLSPNIFSYRVKAEGFGFATLETVLKYKIAIPDVKEKFTISMAVEIPAEDELVLRIFISVKVNDEGAEETMTGVAMEIELPDGYVFDINSKDELQEETNFKKFQALYDNQVLIIHYKSLTQGSVTIKAIRKQKAEGRNAASLRRSAIRVYDDKGNYAVEYYTLSGSQYCDVTDESS